MNAVKEFCLYQVFQLNFSDKLNLIDKFSAKMAHLVTSIIYIVDQHQITFISP